MWLPPDSVNDFLTRGALDEHLGLADDSYLDGVPDSVFKIIVAFFSRMSDEFRIGTRVHGPACRESEREFQHVCRVRAQSPSCQNLAECSSCPREGRRGEIVVAEKVSAVEEEAENNG